jgi:hypothetical protein
MRKLDFIGTVQANTTPELVIPGRSDWPHIVDFAEVVSYQERARCRLDAITAIFLVTLQIVGDERLIRHSKMPCDPGHIFVGDNDSQSPTAVRTFLAVHLTLPDTLAYIGKCVRFCQWESTNDRPHDTGKRTSGFA